MSQDLHVLTYRNFGFLRIHIHKTTKIAGNRTKKERERV